MGEYRCVLSHLHHKRTPLRGHFTRMTATLFIAWLFLGFLIFLTIGLFLALETRKDKMPRYFGNSHQG
jgi:hypothetical protein